MAQRHAGNIVVGVDGSESSKGALSWAIQQADLEHKVITLVHTVTMVTALSSEASAFAPGATGVLQAQGQKVLDAARNQVEWTAPDLEVLEVLRSADPREALLELSQSAAMVVLGSRGRGPLRSMLLGSVGATLVRHAHCPVVVHRLGNQGTGRKGIVVGADATDSRPVLEFAYREASLRKQPLTVVQCSWDMRAAAAGTYVADESTDDVESDRLLLAETLAGMAEKYPDVEVVPQVARGLPQEALLRLGEWSNLIVVGAHPTGRTARVLYGSMSLSVVEHASCPVAVVPL